MRPLAAGALCGLLIASACSLDWDRLDPSLGAGPTGGAGGVGGGLSTGEGGTTSDGGGGAGSCSVDADCDGGSFCGCASIGLIGVAESSDPSAELTITTPTGVTAGDVMIAAVAVRPHDVLATEPAGWTLIRLDTSTENITENLYSYYRVVEDGEAPSHTWAFSETHSGAVGGIIAFRGADPSDPIDAHDGQAVSASTSFPSLSVDAPSVSTSGTESMVVTLYSATSSGDWQPPASMSEAVEIATGISSSGGESLLMSYAPQAMAGDVGVRTAVVARHDDGTAVSQTIALKQLCTSGTCTPVQPDGWTCSEGRQCQSGSCVHNHCCEACDVPGNLGTCSPATTGSSGSPECTPYTCNGTLTTCPAMCSSHAECAGGFYCNGSDACVALRSNGQTCTSAMQCQSGECIDGYCCNNNCTGPCNACNLSGNEGTCTLRPAGTTGSPSCSPYLCSGAASSCPTTCTKDSDCAAGFICMGGSCL